MDESGGGSLRRILIRPLGGDRVQYEQVGSSRQEERCVRQALCRAFDWVVEVLPDSWARAGDGCRVQVCHPAPFGLFCGVWLVDEAWDRKIADRLASLVAVVEREAVPVTLLLPFGGFGASRRAAVSLGFTESEVDEAMLLARADLDPPSSDAPEMVIEPTRTKPELDEARRVAAAGFGVPEEMVEALYEPSFGAHPDLTTYVGRCAGASVSTGASLRHDDVIGVFNVATPPMHRRHGYAAEIVRHIVTTGFDGGAKAAYLVASAEGLGVYRRVGFRSAGRYELLTRPG